MRGKISTLAIKGADVVGENRKEYYIDLPSHQISRNGEFSPWTFKIEASEEDMIRLREYFDMEHEADVDSFYRAHVPYIQYHYDRPNDHYDQNLQKVYELIYELGDSETKQFIESTGVLKDNPINDEI
ncbi:hydrolase [Peribacillus psychrosaccharolyticus]|uniref:hydrolase n=1 Tax=Peribacillus psychrosaccharolyticus TaxID=1407 RepID=UPI002DBF3970|nr:hydrolase [Peribacillus psychrosaccharolyticus]MEC2054829.1 hydrolase [Peribacillus psychrosaccharolyticus]MED3743945.1 hydrolase [Peribacillus psychrosaccharolyticus]